jgi:hypothetical protein
VSWKKSVPGACVFAAVLILGQLSTATAQSKGRLEVRITDHREAIHDFSRVEIEIESIRVKQAPGVKFWQAGWLVLTPQLRKLDLTQYTDNRSALVLDSDALSGRFEAFELKLSRVEGALKAGQKAPRITHALGPMALRFTVPRGVTTSIVLDLVVLDLRDHPPRGYELQLKGYEVRQGGKLVERVPPG